MADITLTIDQGDDETLDVTVKKPDGSALPLTGCKLWFYVKSTPSASDANALITKTSEPGEGITVTSEVGGIAAILIEHVDTSVLPASALGRGLPWSLQVLDGTGKITTLARGNLIVNRDLIQAII